MRRLRVVRDNGWQWSSPQLGMGTFYIERRGKEYYAYLNACLLHQFGTPFPSLSTAIQCCEDNYHTIKYGKHYVS